MMFRDLSKGCLLGFVGLLVLLWLGLALMTHLWLVPQKMPNNYDFFPSWYNSRAALLEGTNPYDDTLNREMRIEMGYPADDPYRQRFYYPATITWILLPFWLLPFPLAIVLWNGLQLLLLFTLPLLVYFHLGWRISPLFLATVAVFSAVPWRHSANVYVLGQFVIFTLACLIFAWVFVTTDRPLLATLALVASTLRAEGILLTAAVLFLLLLAGHYRVIFYWAIAMGIVFALSLVTAGFWIPDFLDGIQGYRENQPTTFPPNFLGNSVLAAIAAAGIVLWGAYLLWDMRALPLRQRLPWRLAVLILVMLLILVQTKDYTLAYALFPIWIVIWAGRDQRWMRGIMLLVMISPWIYNALGANQGNDSMAEQLLSPLTILALLTYQWQRQPKEPAAVTHKQPRVEAA